MHNCTLGLTSCSWSLTTPTISCTPSTCGSLESRCASLNCRLKLIAHWPVRQTHLGKGSCCSKAVAPSSVGIKSRWLDGSHFEWDHGRSLRIQLGSHTYVHAGSSIDASGCWIPQDPAHTIDRQSNAHTTRLIGAVQSIGSGILWDPSGSSWDPTHKSMQEAV